MLPDHVLAAVKSSTAGGTPKLLRIVPKVCGVYLLMLVDEVVYVGQSTDIVGRTNIHIGERSKPFDRVVYVELPEELLGQAERLLIAALSPRLNAMHPSPAARAGLYASRVAPRAAELITASGSDGLGMAAVVGLLGLEFPGLVIDEATLGRMLDRHDRIRWDQARTVFVAR